MKKKICWVTPDCFLDTDLNYNIMSGLLKVYDIHWIVLFKKNGNRYEESDFGRLKDENDNLIVDFLYAHHRMRHPWNFYYYWQIYKTLKCEKPDVIYLNIPPHTPYILPLYFSLPSNKTIVAAHQGEIRYGFKYPVVLRCFRRIAYRYVHYANLFSKTEASRFKINHSHIKIFQINLPPKDFGNPTNKRPMVDKIHPIRFLSFGSIVFAKNIEMLIVAACRLHEQGYNNFVVSINGQSNNWTFYESYIKYPNIFENDIRSIPNELIPNLFNGAHYFVQPYRQVTQSGPMKLAFRYNLPDICSDLSGLKDEIVEGVNGFLFKHNDVDDLVRIMKECIDKHNERYEELRNKMKEFIDKKYSSDVTLEKYCNMFETVIYNK